MKKITTVKENCKGTDIATEALDARSSPEDFIAELSQAAASFILTNREAFDIDDSQAVQELIEALSVEEVTAAILEAVQNPPIEEGTRLDDDPNEDFVDTSPLDDVAPEDATDNSEDSDMVSADVLALFDED